MKLLQLAALRPLCRPLATAAPAATAAPRESPLHRLHQEHNGRLVPFAGYALPVQYGRHGIAASHRHCRRSAALFDVSHMLQTRWRGAAAAECFESISTADVAVGLADGAGAADADGRAALTVLTNAAGGIVDDLIVTRLAGGELFVVSNAGRRDADRAVFEEAAQRFRRAGKQVEVEFVDSEERALLALQGPRAVQVRWAVGRLYFGIDGLKIITEKLGVTKQRQYCNYK